MIDGFSSIIILDDKEKKDIRKLLENIYVNSNVPLLFSLIFTEENKIAKDIRLIEKSLLIKKSIKNLKLKSSLISKHNVYITYKNEELLTEEKIERINEHIIGKYSIYKTLIMIIKMLNIDRNISLLIWFVGLISVILGIFIKEILK